MDYRRETPQGYDRGYEPSERPSSYSDAVGGRAPRAGSGRVPSQGSYAYAQAAPQQAQQAEQAYAAPERRAAAPAKPRVSSLDGLRALAILSVLLYHLEVPWLPSGHMGVVMFFVLTGYLVVGSLVKSVERTGTIDLKTFWVRRFKRIWPSMAVMILVVAALCVLFNHVLLTKMRPDILPSLLFFSNWAYIASGSSYFGAIGGPSPLTHMWYLGVDAQTMVILPLVVLLGMRVFGLGRVGMRRVLLALALVSAVAMALLYVPGADPSRVYYGLDTRIFSVLFGGWLACALPLGGWRSDAPHDVCSQALAELPALVAELVGVVSLAALVLVMVFVPATSAFFYYGGMVLVSLLVVGLLVCLLRPNGLVARAFSLPPILWIGTRSYALYLWHYPIIHLLDADGYAPWWLKLVAVALSLLAAELSWRFIEGPLSDGRALRRLNELVDSFRHGGFSGVGPARSAALGASALVGLIAIVGCIAVPHTTLVPEDAIKSTGDAVDQAMDLSARGAGQGGASTGEGAAQQGAADGTQAQPAPQVQMTAFDVPYDQMTEEQREQVRREIESIAAAQGGNADSALGDTRAAVEQNGPASLEDSGSVVVHAAKAVLDAGMVEPLLIGDSVPGDTDFSVIFPDGFNDSYVGRHPGQAVSVLQGYLGQKVVGNVVILACFSNDNVDPTSNRKLIELLGDKHEVFLVGVVTTEGTADSINADLRLLADTHDNVHYVDWPSACEGKMDSYLWDDQTHVTPRGAAAYLDLIADAVAPYIVAGGGSTTPYTWDSSWW